MRNHETDGRGTQGGCDRARRRFLRRTAGALAAASAAALAPSLAKAQEGEDGGQGNAGGNYGQQGNAPAAVNLRLNFAEIRRNEGDHVTALTNQITAVGGTADAAPTFQNLTVTTRRQFLTTAQAIEDAVAAGYMLALTSPFNSLTTQTVVAQIALVEGRHAGFANVAAGSLLTTNSQGGTPSLEAIPTVAQLTTALATPFIASGGGDLTGFAVPGSASAANDALVLNFLLVLEELEAAFFGNALAGNVRTIFHI